MSLEMWEACGGGGTKREGKVGSRKRGGGGGEGGVNVAGRGPCKRGGGEQRWRRGEDHLGSQGGRGGGDSGDGGERTLEAWWGGERRWQGGEDYPRENKGECGEERTLEARGGGERWWRGGEDHPGNRGGGWGDRGGGTLEARGEGNDDDGGEDHPGENRGGREPRAKGGGENRGGGREILLGAGVFSLPEGGGGWGKQGQWQGENPGSGGDDPGNRGGEGRAMGARWGRKEGVGSGKHGSGKEQSTKRGRCLRVGE